MINILYHPIFILFSWIFIILLSCVIIYLVLERSFMVEHISSTDPDFFLIDTETEDINKKCILIGTYDQVFREYEFLADLTPGKYMIIHYEDLDPEEKELWTAS